MTKKAILLKYKILISRILAISLLITVVMVFGCKPFVQPVHGILFKNNTDHNLRFIIADLHPEIKPYPDTILPQRNLTSGILPQSGSFFTIGGSIPEYFLLALPADTLSIYFFHPDTLAKYEWETVRTEYKVLARYDLSVKNLIRHNEYSWQVNYPPGEELEGAKIFIP